MRRLFTKVIVIVLVVSAILSAIFIYYSPNTDRPWWESGQQWWTDRGDEEADFIVSSEVVLSPQGSEAYTGSNLTDALDWAVHQEGKTVFVPRGEYNLTTSLHMAFGVTLIGEGDDESGTVFNFSVDSKRASRIEIENVDDVTLKHFRVIGFGNIEIQSDGGHHGRHLIENVTIDHTELLQPGAFMTWTSEKGILDGLAFIGCKAIGTDCIGFLLSGDISNNDTVRTLGGWTKNIYFKDCLATYCGYYEQFNPWVCGYDLAEGTNIENLYLLRCEATHNWIDGFHFERMPLVLNAVLENCTAYDNSIKGPDLGSSFAWNDQIHSITLINTTRADIVV